MAPVSAKVHSTAVQKKSGYYVYTSLVISCFFFALNIADYVSFLAYRRAGWMPVDWQFSVMLGHVVGFYFFLAGFIYSKEAQQDRMVRLAIVALVINIIAFTMRLVYELRYGGYRPVRYI